MHSLPVRSHIPILSVVTGVLCGLAAVLLKVSIRAIYLVKINVKTDDLEDVERWLEGEEDAENEAVAGGSADASDAAGETLPDDNIAQYGSGSDDE